MLTDVEEIILRTAVVSPQGVAFTVGGTPGAFAAIEMSSRGWLTNLGPPPWSRHRGDREWAITLEGRVTYARHMEISASERTADLRRGDSVQAPQASGSAAGLGVERR